MPAPAGWPARSTFLPASSIAVYSGCTIELVAVRVAGGALVNFGNAGTSNGLSRNFTCAGDATIVGFSYRQETHSGYQYTSTPPSAGLHDIGPVLCSDGTCGVQSALTATTCGGFGSTGGYQLPSPPC